MCKLLPRLCIAAGLMIALGGCSGDYHVYQRASASESGAARAAEAPPPVDAASAVDGAPAGMAADPQAEPQVAAPAVDPGAADPAVVDPAGVDPADGGAAGGGAIAQPPSVAAPGVWDAIVPPAPEPPAPEQPPSSPPAAALPPPAIVPAQGSAPNPAANGPAIDPSLVRLANAGGPVRLEIPSIGVDAAIERVGLTPEPERAMDAPKGMMNVGWYEKGFQPGEAGNAVIAGHLDTSTGGPAVFWDLDKVNAGDEVYVTYANGDRYTFIVEDWELYDHDAQGPIIDSIFGRSQSSDLNLVTCDGAWDHGAATYSKRLVVFTTLVAEATELAGE